jgi:hypothetical protein
MKIFTVGQQGDIYVRIGLPMNIPLAFEGIQVGIN